MNFTQNILLSERKNHESCQENMGCQKKKESMKMKATAWKTEIRDHARTLAMDVVLIKGGIPL